ncbi:hypothetical protein [Psychrobacter sp. VH5]|uniref:hypothetical protein n=1 Tax=Psychrobacter sp. VH5 TaxID=3423439 RepID=UPI003D6537FF
MQGNFVCGSFYDSHIHLDKACILDRCTIEQGNLEEAVEETGKAKEAFTEAGVYARTSRVIEMAIKKVPSGCALSLRPIKKQTYVALRR